MSNVLTTKERGFGAPTQDDAIGGSLLQKIEQFSAKVSIVGLGYVGLPLLRSLHDCGYPVLGFDVDAEKVDKLNGGVSYISHLGGKFAEQLASSPRFEATTEAERLAEADVVILCVPTPLGLHREPDLSFVRQSAQIVGRHLRPGQLIVLESTTYPGTTRDEVLPILANTGLRCGEDFFLAYSPEREDPGRTDMMQQSVPKLVGATDDRSLQLALSIYRKIVENVHAVSSAEVAEAAKLLENIYRAVNIALVNELKIVLTDMGIDIWEVIEAAATKPFGYQPFYPGPGLGGHCIPIDPFYLTWKARALGHHTKFIELAGEINSNMPIYVLSRIIEALNESGKSLKQSRVLVVGLAYKRNVGDSRETPAAEILLQLQQRGASVSYHDPYVPDFPTMRKYHLNLHSVPLSEDVVKSSDCVVIVTDHSGIDYGMLAKNAALIVDTRNAMAAVPAGGARVIKA